MGLRLVRTLSVARKVLVSLGLRRVAQSQRLDARDRRGLPPLLLAAAVAVLDGVQGFTGWCLNVVNLTFAFALAATRGALAPIHAPVARSKPMHPARPGERSAIERAYLHGMPRWDSREIGGLIGPCCVAGISPLCLVFSADLMFGPWSGSKDNLYYLQAIVGPPLIALLFVPHLGRRSFWVAAGGVLVALVIMLAVFVVFAGILSASES